MTDRTFDLTLRTHREELVTWLEGLPEDRRAAAAEQALSLGYQVLTFAQASATEETARRFFQPVLKDVQQLNENIVTLMKYSEKSQRLGEIGEAIVVQHLKAALPNDRFDLVSDTGHQADVHGFLRVGDIEERVLIEVKLYTNDVPSAEIDKFRRDLAGNRVRYGLMVSLRSRLTGVAGQYEIEANDDYVAVLVPNAGFQGERVAWGAALLKALVLHERRTGKRLQAAAVEQAWRRLQVHFNELESAARQVGDLRQAVRKAQQAITASLDTLHDQVTSADLQLQRLVGTLMVRVHEELEELPTLGSRAALPPPPDPAAVTAWLAALDPKDKRGPTLRGLHTLAAELGVDLSLEGEKLVLARDGVRLAETTGTGTRVDVSWFVDPHAEQRLLLTVEKIKDDSVLIDGKDPKRLLDRVRERISSAT